MKRANKSKVSKIPKIQDDEFFEIVTEAQKASKHTEYLTDALEQYDEYKETFSKILIDPTTKSLKSVYFFRVKLTNKTPVWRDIAILGSQTLLQLAETIIESMGWVNDHMHGFSPKKLDGVYIGKYSPLSIYAPEWEDEPHPTFKSDQVLIANLNFEKCPKWDFVFDFGYGFEFELELRDVKEKVKVKEVGYPLPVCIDQRGVGPRQYPDWDVEEMYGETDIAKVNDLLLKHSAHFVFDFDEGCPHCKQLKEQGVELQWFPDETNEEVDPDNSV